MAETEIIDADAYDPIPTRKLRYQGKDHGVLSPLDLDQITLLKLKRFVEHFDSLATLDEQNAFVIELLCKVVPTLDPAHLGTEPSNKLLWLLNRATAPLQGEASGPLATGQTASS